MASLWPSSTTATSWTSRRDAETAPPALREWCGRSDASIVASQPERHELPRGWCRSGSGPADSMIESPRMKTRSSATSWSRRRHLRPAGRSTACPPSTSSTACATGSGPVGATAPVIHRWRREPGTAAAAAAGGPSAGLVSSMGTAPLRAGRRGAGRQHRQRPEKPTSRRRAAGMAISPPRRRRAGKSPRIGDCANARSHVASATIRRRSMHEGPAVRTRHIVSDRCRRRDPRGRRPRGRPSGRCAHRQQP